MKKRLISLLLVVMMICTLLPVSIMADNDSTKSSITENIKAAVKELLISDTRTKIEPKVPSGETGMVVVPVFGKELTDILDEGKLFSYTKEALQVRLSGKSIIPEAKITITGIDENTKSIQQQELDLAKYSVFNDILPHVNVTVQGKETFKDSIKLLREALLKIPFSNEESVKKLFDAFRIPYEDEDIEAIFEESEDEDPGNSDPNNDKLKTVVKNILNVLGRGEFTDSNGTVHKFSREFLGHTIGFDGLGIDEEYCDDVDEFFTALYRAKAGDKVDQMVADAIHRLANDQLADYAGFAYQVYVKEDLPAGDYQVKIELIDRQGFTTKSLVKKYPVTVKAASVSYAGETRTEGTTTIDFEKLFAIEEDELEKIDTDSDNEIIKLFNFVVDAKDKLTSLYNGIVDNIPNNKEIKIPSLGTLTLPLVVDFTLGFTGVWLDRQDPYIGFTNQDLGGNLIAKTEQEEKAQFVMVDRDQLLNVMSAMIDVGKDTFTNTVNSLKEIYQNDGSNEGLPTWNEFTKMHQDILSLDTTGETPQVQFDAASMMKLVWIYVKMMDIPEVWDHFLANDVRLPAILMATADDEGNVKISEASNVTLVWMLDALIKIADLSQDALEELGAELREGGGIEAAVTAVFEGAELENDDLKQLLINVLVWISENTEEGSEAVVEILKATSGPIKGLINTWIYPLLQNDALFHLVGGFLEVEGGEGRMHGILTDKMPDSYYLLLQKKAPEGYLINPMVYTVKLDWSEDGWVYAKIANLGIVAPYFAEDYYTFLRNNSIAKTTDRILSRLSQGKEITILEDLMNGTANVTEQTIAASTYTIAFQAWIVYNFMGGRFVYTEENGGQTKLQEDITKYLIAQGKTAENLMKFSGDVYKRSKAVVSADLNGDGWAFYNASKSIKENIVVQTTAIAKQISDSIVTEGNKVNEAVKTVVKSTIDSLSEVDTTSKTAEYVDQAIAKAKESVTSMLRSALISAIKKTTSLFASMLKRK